MSLENLDLEAQSLCQKIKSKLADAGRTLRLQDGWKVIQDAAAQIVLIIEKNIGKSLAGPEKKAKAMAVIEQIVDIVCNLINIPGVPSYIEAWLDRYIKMFLMSIADGSIDALVKTFHDTGVFPPKSEG